MFTKTKTKPIKNDVLNIEKFKIDFFKFQEFLKFESTWNRSTTI